MQTKLGQCESGLQRMIAHARERRDGALLERAEELERRLTLSEWDIRLLDNVWGELLLKGYIKA